MDQVTPPRADTTTGLTRGVSSPQRPAFEMFAPVEPGYDGPTYHASVEEPPSSPPPPPAASVPLDMQSTVDLLTLAKTGDDRAVDALFERCVPPLRRWARGRLPSGARGLLETQDVVQDAVFNVLRRLDKFEARHHGALLAYLRQAVLNRIRDEARTLARRPAPVELDHQHFGRRSVALELAIDHADLERYEAALARRRRTVRLRGDRSSHRDARELRGGRPRPGQADRQRRAHLCRASAAQALSRDEPWRVIEAPVPRLLASVADGESPDWTGVESAPLSTTARDLNVLRAIASLADVHRTLIDADVVDAEASWTGPGRIVGRIGPAGQRSDALPPREQWGAFILVDRLGSGTSADVFRAYEPRLDRHVALKLFKPGASSSEDRRAAMLQEARALARVRHPNVAASMAPTRLTTPSASGWSSSWDARSRRRSASEDHGQRRKLPLRATRFVRRYRRSMLRGSCTVTSRRPTWFAKTAADWS